MDRSRPGLIERAFQLARLGAFTTITQITSALRSEGYDSVQSQMSGSGLRNELRLIMRSRAPSTSDRLGLSASQAPQTSSER